MLPSSLPRMAEPEVDVQTEQLQVLKSIRIAVQLLCLLVLVGIVVLA